MSCSPARPRTPRLPSPRRRRVSRTRRPPRRWWTSCASVTFPEDSMPLPLPTFPEGPRVGELFLERAARVTDEGRRYAVEHRVRPAREDRLRIPAFGIDTPVAFCHPEARLFVPGAVEDAQRTLRWLYPNLDPPPPP